MRPWVKVWRPRNGSAFEARVPAPARMLFRGMLALFDEDGRMPLPKKPKLHLAFAMAHGYERTERQALKKQLDALLAHGCLVAEQGDDGFWMLTAPGFASFQGSESTQSSRREKSRVRTTSERLGDNLASTTSKERDDYAQRTGKVLARKPPKSLDRNLQEGEGDKEKEGEGDARAREPAPPSQNEPFSPTSGHGIWRLLEMACARAGIPFAEHKRAVDDVKRQAIFDELGPEALVADFEAFSRYLQSLEEDKRAAVRPWLRWCDKAGRWASNAPPPAGVVTAKHLQFLSGQRRFRAESEVLSMAEQVGISADELVAWEHSHGVANVA